jgi:hypothetical protein
MYAAEVSKKWRKSVSSSVNLCLPKRSRQPSNFESPSTSIIVIQEDEDISW